MIRGIKLRLAIMVITIKVLGISIRELIMQRVTLILCAFRAAFKDEEIDFDKEFNKVLRSLTYRWTNRVRHAALSDKWPKPCKDYCCRVSTMIYDRMYDAVFKEES